MTQLDFQNGPLDSLHPRIMSDFDVVVPSVLGMVAQSGGCGLPIARRR